MYTDEQAKEMIHTLFDKIQKAKHAEHLRILQKEKPYCSFKMQGKEYPRLKLRIDASEIELLKDSGALSADNVFSSTLADGVYGGFDNPQHKMTPLEKLLYSILWKNGDLLKERLVIEGITADSNKKSERIVFYEFGGYLSGKNSFILDQHTLRCFAIFDAELSDVRGIRAHADILIHKKRDVWRAQMEQFYTDICGSLNGEGKLDFAYETDRLLFGAGKFLKNRKIEVG